MAFQLGVAGLGLGARLMLPVIATDPRFRLAAAADPREDAGRALTQATGARHFSGFEDMVQDERLDVVYIATPTHLHAQHVKEAVARGLHVIVEKPVAACSVDAFEIAEVVASAGTALVCGHTHAFDGPIVEMRRLIEAGELGVLSSVITWNANDYLYRPRAAWDLDLGNGGGVVFNQGAHQVEILRTLVGDVVDSVYATTTMDARRHVPGSFHAVLRFRSGLSATAIFSGGGFFDTSELFGHWFGERGEPRDPETHRRTWASFLGRQDEADPESEDRARDQARYVGGSLTEDAASWTATPFFGMTLACGTAGEVRQTPHGLRKYTSNGMSELPLDDTYVDAARRVLTELYDAAMGVRPATHDAQWAATTVAVCEAIERSAEIGEVVQLGS